MTQKLRSGSGGFSLIELLVALTVSLLVTSAVFAMLHPAHGAFQTQPEAADVAQRLRASADALVRDLRGAGSGPLLAAPVPASGQLAAAVFPLRIGRRNADSAGTFDSSRIALWQVKPASPQCLLAAPLASASGVAAILPGAGCASGDPTCGFRPGMLVAAFGHSGIIDLFSVTAVAGSAITLQHNQADSALVHPAGRTTLAEVTAPTYFFRHDAVLGYAQLRRYAGDGGADVPVADHLTAMSIEYYGDAEPPRVVAGTNPLRVTYGPHPPQLAEQLTAYPPGENCAFMRTPGGGVGPRLAVLSPDPVLVPLPASLLTDGPWCPDDQSPTRYDADLLRVRQVVLSLRVEAASDSLRGPAGLLFMRAGTGSAPRWVPDREARIVVAPPALNAGH